MSTGDWLAVAILAALAVTAIRLGRRPIDEGLSQPIGSQARRRLIDRVDRERAEHPERES